MSLPQLALRNPSPNIIGSDKSVRQEKKLHAAPRSWSYMHRIKWAKSLPVSPGARLTAVIIADHINEKTGQWKLSAVGIAAESGRVGKFADRAVRRHVNDELRAYFGVEDRPGQTWRFTMPRPLMEVVPPRTKCPDTPDKMSDVPCDLPSNKEKEQHARASCPVCDHSWPAQYGTKCHVCTNTRPSKQKLPPARLRVGAPRGGAVKFDSPGDLDALEVVKATYGDGALPRQAAGGAVS